MLANTAILETLIPEKEWKPFQQGQEEEGLQPLMDLGYLGIDQNKNKQAILEAVRTFRNEYQQLGWLQQEMNLPNPNAILPNRELDELEIKLLHLLVDMDGDFKIDLLPLEGEQSIVSRVIYFRLRVLGFCNQNVVQSTFDQQVIENLLAPLRRWMTLQISFIRLVNLIGNVPELIRTAWRLGGLDKQVVCFKYRPMNAFEPKFKHQIETEQLSVVHTENATLETISTELEALAGPKEKRKMKRAVDTKILRRQSKAEQLRAQIDVILQEMQADLNKGLEQGSELAKSIKQKQEVIAIKTQKRTHLQQDIKELKGQLQQMQDLKKEAEKLTKRKKEKAERLDPQINYEEQLNLQQSFLQQLEQKKAEAPPELAKRFKVPIASAKKKIKELLSKLVVVQQIQVIDARLKTIVQIRAQHVDPHKEIDRQKKEVDLLGSELKQLKKELKKLERAQVKEQTDFSEEQAKAQKAIRQKKEKFDRLLEKLQHIPRRFRRELKAYLDPVFYEKVTDELLDREDSSFFDRQVKNSYNQFLIRLIQLHQWTNGYYNGTLDSDLGELTFNSIREIDEDVKSLKLRFVLYQIDPQKGTWLLNIRYFVDEMIASLDEFQEQGSFEKVVETFENEINENPKIRGKRAEFDRQWKKAIRQTKEDLKNNVVRRVYFGVRSIARSIIRGIKRIVGLIFSGIKKLFRLLRNFVQMLYREIRDGLKKFAQGINFLFGKRTITTSTIGGEPALVTRYDFDCDVLSMVTPNAKGLVKTHIAKNYEMVHNLDFALILVGKVINWVLKFAIFGYATIFIRIALYFKKLVKKFLVKGVFGLGVKVLL